MIYFIIFAAGLAIGSGVTVIYLVKGPTINNSRERTETQTNSGLMPNANKIELSQAITMDDTYELRRELDEKRNQ